MPTEAIQFGNLLESGNAELAGAPPSAYNVLIDGRGAVRRRPAIATWAGFPAVSPEPTWEVSGMSSLADVALVYVTGRRTIYRIDGGVATPLSTAGAASMLDAASRPIFTETRSRLVIAGGGLLQKVEPTAFVSDRLGGSPPYATHPAAMASKIFVDDNTPGATYQGRLRWSGNGTTGEETWDPLDTVDTEASPDDCVALHTDSNELWAFGTRTLQIYQPDPSSILAPRTARRIGCAAPYSVIAFDNKFAWLDHKRTFVVSDGRALKEISEGINETLDNLATVSDCFGFRVALGQFIVLVWHFPTERKTFAWQVDGGWSNWSGWSHTLGHTPLDVRCGFYWEAANLNLLGTSAGQVAQWSFAANQDLGNLIKAECTTGFIDHGSSVPKVCREVRITRKGNQTGVVRLSWRDDTGSTVAPIEVTLSGQQHTVTLRSLGVYRARQWTLDMTDASQLVIAKVEEDFDLLAV